MNKTFIGTLCVLMILAFALAVDFVVIINADALGAFASVATPVLALLNLFLFYFAYSLAMKTIEMTK